MSQNQQLIRLLEQLRDELRTLDSHDKHARLSALTDQIELQLEQTDQHHALAQELSDEVVEFEVEHPTIAGVIQNLIRLLGNIGV